MSDLTSLCLTLIVIVAGVVLSIPVIAFALFVFSKAVGAGFAVGKKQAETSEFSKPPYEGDE